MKKTIAFIITVIVVMSAFMCAGITASAEEKTLTVFNWGEYISDGSDGTLDVIKAFEQQTGIKVNYVTYSSNEDMYASLSSGAVSYDVIIPSDYMIARLAAEGKLMKLDYNNIPNYQYIDEAYKGQYYDPNNEYTVPYNVGLVGIIYNTKMVKEAPTGWDALWDENYAKSILQFNNSRDAFATAQFKLGLDVNSSDLSTWQRAYEELEKQKPLLKSYVMDEIFITMEGENAAIATYYAGDFFKMYGEQPNLAFVYPKEGTNIFVDCMCIPTCCKNKEGAEAFINFMCSEEIAIANGEYICYASPNVKVRENAEYQEFLTELHPDAYSVLYGVDEEYLTKCQYYHDLDDATRENLDKLWSTLKTDLNIVVIGSCIGIVLIAVIVFIVLRIRKSKRDKMLYE